MKGKALGRTLIADDGTPLGFCGVHFQENGEGQSVGIIFFYGGPNGYFMKKYLSLALRGMRECAEILKNMGVTHAYCVADCRIPRADYFIKWMGGELVPEAEDPNGDVYVLRFDEMKLLNREG